MHSDTSAAQRGFGSPRLRRRRDRLGPRLRRRRRDRLRRGSSIRGAAADVVLLRSSCGPRAPDPAQRIGRPAGPDAARRRAEVSAPGGGSAPLSILAAERVPARATSIRSLQRTGGMRCQGGRARPPRRPVASRAYPRSVIRRRPTGGCCSSLPCCSRWRREGPRLRAGRQRRRELPQGALFTTIWIPGVSFKSFASAGGGCSAARSAALVDRVDAVSRSQLAGSRAGRAADTKDVRIP